MTEFSLINYGVMFSIGIIALGAKYMKGETDNRTRIIVLNLLGVILSVFVIMPFISKASGWNIETIYFIMLLLSILFEKVFDFLIKVSVLHVIAWLLSLFNQKWADSFDKYFNKKNKDNGNII